MDRKAESAGSRDKSIYKIWSSPNYVLFVVGAGSSHITNWMQRVGVGWLAWELTGSTAWLGAVAAADSGTDAVSAEQRQDLLGDQIDRDFKISLRKFALTHHARQELERHHGRSRN